MCAVLKRRYIQLDGVYTLSRIGTRRCETAAVGTIDGETQVRGINRGNADRHSIGAGGATDKSEGIRVGQRVDLIGQRLAERDLAPVWGSRVETFQRQTVLERNVVAVGILLNRAPLLT